MQVHDLKKSTLSRDAKRVGRGGKRGKTSGKGMKGQKARQGNSTRPELRDIIKKLPKLRGAGVHGNRNKAIMKNTFAVNVSTLESVFAQGGLVTPKILVEKGVASKVSGKLPTVKILGSGDISVKVDIVGCMVSDTAREKITSAGGSVK